MKLVYLSFSLILAEPLTRVKRQFDGDYSEYYDYEYYYYNEQGDQVDSFGNIIKPKAYLFIS